MKRKVLLLMIAMGITLLSQAQKRERNSSLFCLSGSYMVQVFGQGDLRNNLSATESMEGLLRFRPMDWMSIGVWCSDIAPLERHASIDIYGSSYGAESSLTWGGWSIVSRYGCVEYNTYRRYDTNHFDINMFSVGIRIETNPGYMASLFLQINYFNYFKKLRVPLQEGCNFQFGVGFNLPPKDF